MRLLRSKASGIDSLHIIMDILHILILNHQGNHKILMQIPDALTLLLDLMTRTVDCGDAEERDNPMPAMCASLTYKAVLMLTDVMHYHDPSRRAFMGTEINGATILLDILQKWIGVYRDGAGDTIDAYAPQMIDALCMMVYHTSGEVKEFQDLFALAGVTSLIAKFLQSCLDEGTCNLAFILEEPYPSLSFASIPFCQSTLLAAHSLLVMNEVSQTIVANECMSLLFRETMRLHCFLCMAPQWPEKDSLFSIYSVLHLLLASMREDNERIIAGTNTCFLSLNYLMATLIMHRK